MPCKWMETSRECPTLKGEKCDISLKKLPQAGLEPTRPAAEIAKRLDGQSCDGFSFCLARVIFIHYKPRIAFAILDF